MLFLLAGCTNAGKQAAEEETTFTNPVIYADVPDVDVIRVGSDYYMISTTAHMSPGAPIMHPKTWLTGKSSAMCLMNSKRAHTMIWKAVISTAADNGLLPYAITTGFSMYSSVQETNPTFIRQKIRQENGNRSL